MGRGKVVLKRIENKINRQVSFSKRRNGLLKKAYELSLLCDADVALIIFSTHGKLYEFCSSSSIQKTLERYKKYMCTTSAPEFPSDDPTSNNHEEYLRLKARVEILQSSQRNLLAEDLNQLSTNELDQLESQINKSLRLIRSKKTQTLLDQLYDLTRKEQMLQESNHALRKRIQEFTREDDSHNASNDPIRSPQLDDELFRSSGRETSLQIGFQQITSNTDMPSNRCVYPPTWAR